MYEKSTNCYLNHYEKRCLMDLEKYKELVELTSKQIAEKFLSEETDLTDRALLLDADMERLVSEIGLEAMKRVFRETLDGNVKKKSPKD
ncbi:MAG: hypothetical protein GY867_08600 [bacterium]|nr:hypothetical protein [bacterium]